MFPRERLTRSEMFSPNPATAEVIEPRTFGTFSWMQNRRGLLTGATSTAGRFTLLRMMPDSRKSRVCAAAMTAQFSSLSGVDAPRCGVQITPFAPSSASEGKSVT